MEVMYLHRKVVNLETHLPDPINGKSHKKVVMMTIIVMRTWSFMWRSMFCFVFLPIETLSLVNCIENIIIFLLVISEFRINQASVWFTYPKPIGTRDWRVKREVCYRTYHVDLPIGFMLYVCVNSKICVFLFVVSHAQ